MRDYAPLLERAFAFLPVEGQYEIEDIEGRVPDFVRGTCYLNGPARFSVGDRPYRHWLAGDGMVAALEFREGKVLVRNRFVRSTKWTAEREAGRAVFRTFGTSFEGDRLNHRGFGLESPVNVSVYRWGSRLLAFGEQGLPWELDEKLRTVGPHTFDDQINEVSPFSAHPKIDAESGELFNFGVSFSGLRPALVVYRFDSGGRLVLRKRHPLDYPCSIHDFGLSPQYTCFVLNPYLLDVKKVITKGTSLIDSLSWQPEQGSWLMIAARESGGQRDAIPLEGVYCLHFINAWESGRRLMVDVLELEEPVYPQYQPLPELFRNVGPGRPVRYVVDTDHWKIVERIALDYDRAPDFPSLDPRLHMREYDDFWMLGIAATGKEGRKFFDQLAHCRWSRPRETEVYQAPPFHYLGGEPVFLPDPGSASGAVICQYFDAEKRSSGFFLFEASNVARGPIARLGLRDPLPPLFHASFASERRTGQTDG